MVSMQKERAASSQARETLHTKAAETDGNNSAVIGAEKRPRRSRPQQNEEECDRACLTTRDPSFPMLSCLVVVLCLWRTMLGAVWALALS